MTQTSSTWSHADKATARNLGKHTASFVFLLVVLVIRNVAGPQLVSQLLLDIEKHTVIAHQLFCGYLLYCWTVTGPRYVRYILITALFTQLIWENTLLESCDRINRHQFTQGFFIPLSPGMIILTVWRESAALNSSCETISIAYLIVEQISAILLCEDNVTPNCSKMWQFNVALIDRKGA